MRNTGPLFSFYTINIVSVLASTGQARQRWPVEIFESAPSNAAAMDANQEAHAKPQAGVSPPERRPERLRGKVEQQVAAQHQQPCRHTQGKPRAALAGPAATAAETPALWHMGCSKQAQNEEPAEGTQAVQAHGPGFCGVRQFTRTGPGTHGVVHCEPPHAGQQQQRASPVKGQPLPSNEAMSVCLAWVVGRSMHAFSVLPGAGLESTEDRVGSVAASRDDLGECVGPQALRRRNADVRTGGKRKPARNQT